MTRAFTRGLICCASAIAVAGCSGRDRAPNSAGGEVDTTIVPSTSGAVADRTNPMTDANILSTLGVLNGAEMTEARVARRRANNGSVKGLADLLLSDHAQMQSGLDSLAKAKNIVPAAGPRAQALQTETKSERERLEQLTGAEFDRAYVQAQVKAHEEAIAEANRLAGVAQDGDLRAAIQRALPKLQTHLDSARAVEQRLGTRT